MQSVLHKVVGPKEVHPGNLDGRVAIVTGGALGIGYEVSRALALAGVKVIMVNRKEEQGADAIETIKKEKADAQVEWKHCDMGNLKEVKEVFTSLRESLERLDFLVLSAGINTNQYGEDADGIDRHFGVNYLGHYYVCNQLWPLLRKTGKLGEKPAPRIVFESSEMHRTAPSDVHFGSLEEINDSSMDPTRLYGRTKLAMILFAKFGLRDRVIKPNGDNVYALSVHPGAVNTAMQQQWKDAYPGITGKLLSNAMLFMGRDPEQGSYSALWALTSDEIEEKNMNGFYFNDPGQPGKETSQASDENLGSALWDLSQRIITDKIGKDALVDWNAKA
ncbi:putative short-chain dehydrogenase TIC 32, chloroplastic [Setomelanomma holmii]|uniref:Short-chain dehydrogenase TIC 32, chloroplastic n=1 Tax=Setomelanomma holmii TaxID=210430 RepID=A0A9P4H4V0_9PLEO|nr:putative short-chain dehydrogenase TIC 32, chloroplastic [Setomelanomma holmii]